MKGDMKFELDDRVLIKSRGKQGLVKQYRVEGFIDRNGNTYETIKYYVKFGQYLTDWFHQDDLTHVDKYDDSFELALLDLLIDVNLKVNNLDLVRTLHTRKQNYKKG